MPSRALALALFAVCLVSTSTAHASNLRFLEFSPSAYFNDKDWELLRSTTAKLLAEGKKGDSASWKNDDNGHNGKLTVIGSFAKFGTTCRRVEVFSDAVVVKATRLVDMCKDEEGAWKILN